MRPPRSGDGRGTGARAAATRRGRRSWRTPRGGPASNRAGGTTGASGLTVTASSNEDDLPTWMPNRHGGAGEKKGNASKTPKGSQVRRRTVRRRCLPRVNPDFGALFSGGSDDFLATERCARRKLSRNASLFALNRPTILWRGPCSGHGYAGPRAPSSGSLHRAGLRASDAKRIPTDDARRGHSLDPLVSQEANARRPSCAAVTLSSS